MGKGSRAKPAKETKASEKSEKVEQQVVVAHPATPTKASKKSEKVEQQQVVACEKEKKMLDSSRWGVLLKSKLKSRCHTSATCKLGTRSWSV